MRLLPAMTVIGLIVLALATPVFADGAADTAQIPSPTGVALDPQETLILFYSDACPHCHNELRWLAEIEDDFPNISFQRFEIQVTDNRANQEYFAAVMDAYDSNTRGWPRTVIGDRVFIGFDPGDGEETWVDQFEAWVGYRNQLHDALTALQSQLTAE